MDCGGESLNIDLIHTIPQIALQFGANTPWSDARATFSPEILQNR